jgi:hypothetical protein
MKTAVTALLVSIAIAGCATPSLNLITVVLPGGRMQVGQVNENKQSERSATAGAVATTVIPGMDHGATATTAAPAPWRPLN